MSSGESRGSTSRLSRSFHLSWKKALLIFAIALLFRSLYLYEASQQPEFGLFYMDEEYNLGWARAIATGEWNAPFDRFEGQPYFRAPLYSYFLAAMLALFDGRIVPALILQILIGSLSCVLVSAIGTNCFGRRVGMTAGILCSLYWVLVYFDGELLLPVLLVFLLLLGFWILFRAVERDRLGLAALAGITFGLFSVTRPNILAFLPFLLYWTWRIPRNRPTPRATLFTGLVALGFLLPPTAATIRNRVVGDDWVVVASQGGVNFYIGNNPESNGLQAIVPGTRSTWWGGFEDTKAIAEEATGRSLKPSEVSDYWYRRAFSFISGQPGDWIRLLGRKTIALTGDPEPPNNEAYEIRARETRTLRIPLGFGLLFGLFLLSLPLQLRSPQRFTARDRSVEMRRRRYVSLVLQFILVYALTFVAFFVTGRYRVPLVPLIVIGSSLTVAHLVDLVVDRRLRAAGILCFSAIVVVLALRSDPLGIRNDSIWFARYSVAVERLDLGDLDGGIERLESILEDDTVQDPTFYGTLIRAYEKRNRPADRREIVLIAEYSLQFYPDNPDLLWFAMNGHLEAGNDRAAMHRAEQYIEQTPLDLRGWHVGFRAAVASNDLESAGRFLSGAANVDSDHPLVARMQRELATARSYESRPEPVP